MNIKAIVMTGLAMSGITFLGVQKNALAGTHDVVVVNDTSQPIIAIHLKPSDFRRWQSVRMHSRIFPGTTSNVYINNTSNSCIYNVRVIYLDGSYDAGTYNLCYDGVLSYYGPGGEYW